MAQTIKPYEAYGAVSDGTLVTIGTAVQTAMTGNPHFPNPPVDLAVSVSGPLAEQIRLQRLERFADVHVHVA